MSNVSNPQTLYDQARARVDMYLSSITILKDISAWIADNIRKQGGKLILDRAKNGYDHVYLSLIRPEWIQFCDTYDVNQLQHAISEYLHTQTDIGPFRIQYKSKIFIIGWTV